MDEYSGRLEAMHLPAEAMKLIDRYVSEYNAIGSRYGMLAYIRGFPTAGSCSWTRHNPEGRRWLMDSYNLSYTPGFEQQKRLSDLARRCRGVKYPAASSGYLTLAAFANCPC